MFKRSILIVWAVGGLIALISACTPLEAKTSYQGRLTNASGAPVSDGNYQMTLRLYGEDDAAVGQALWTETQSVSVNDGLFNIMLGSTETITTSLFAQKLWLGVEVESDGEMTPRQELTGAPYAMSLVAGAGIQGVINEDDPLPSSLNVSNTGSGFGIGVNAIGRAGLAMDGGVSGLPTGETGLLVDNFLHGAVITSTAGTGVQAKTSGGTANDDYGMRGESEVGDGVFGWGMGSGSGDTGLTGRGENGYGVYGFSINSDWGFYTPDDLFVGGSCTGCALQYIAQNGSNDVLRPGDTVSAAGVNILEGMSKPIMNVAPTTVGDAVLGIVVGATEMFIAENGIDDTQPGPHFGEIGGDANPGDYLIIIIQGLAQVRASDTGIKVGDLVYQANNGVTSQFAGPAIGMALDVVDENGLVWVLVGFH